MKNFNYLIIITLLLLLGCRDENLLVENNKTEEVAKQENIHNRFSSSFVSIKTLKTLLKNSRVKLSVDALAEGSKKNETDILFYEKVYDAAKDVTTFTLPLTDYSKQSPFILKHIITIENGIEKYGFLKIIPNSTPKGNIPILSDFSGTIQILGEDLKIFSQSEYLHGNPVSPKSTSTVSSKFDCWNQTIVIVHNCSNGGNHPPGVSCNAPDVNDGYYEISTKMVCGRTPNYLEGPPEAPTISNGGGYSPLHKVLTNPNFMYTSYITEPNHLYLLNHTAYWASMVSDPLTSDEVNILNEKIGVFVNNDSIFELIDDYYTQVYTSGTNYLQGVYNDSKINNLLKYLFDTPTQKNADFVKWGIQFLAQNPTVSWERFQSMLTFAQDFLQQNPNTINPEQIFSRLKVLDDALTQNPNLLIDIPCSQLPKWKDVATHQVPQSVKTKMQNIKNQTNYYDNWALTDLDNGLGVKLNMDLFPVKITSLPNKPGTNVKYNPVEFFDFFRKNINLFAEKFNPTVDNYYGINDTALWFSNNPLGALIHIDITPDDGTVVCSGYWTNSWMFTTVKAPKSWSYDGIHPVAGNRLFSYYTDPNDNTMYIYTRGVDRVSYNYSDNSTILNSIIQSLAFLGADNLWKGMQAKLSTFIVNNGGYADKVTPEIYRPNYNKIKNYIKGNAPLSSLGCN
ncbi:hypothetical protein LF887_14495 [Chryseobacterium sp. MEBOG06]|uniref:hypothetical protein n=1 Tax=Chryseobacterium sp. MEBOG06 TaxID=2879938 RepID=UPI001F37EE20|nr:hypothetical protein [Chryseobacterium sp. MEBOG06]UKB82213.1 hypothetical protein LF887_14495 [Chryseobacterium sp. MEBOG06]